eukprot:CAMPEP_0119117346 /NCGR_PEP_ID=MMETSP1180-20130426/52789_1 /TAXON_ID=3052 ORGANISM="Chlamydomonas cf sp, Strain CCMP681" /NCGR_SAMPLE_ID=MMETSP1180 /ASSEMBLY_ACC=CAM_ASM_000741 /LENGTH=72 /DNA_ID=CAMNT_0007106593 /DNA_START=1271 /DNA_END=1486 /DNA_ORIENTATION=+
MWPPTTCARQFSLRRNSGMGGTAGGGMGAGIAISEATKAKGSPLVGVVFVATPGLRGPNISRMSSLVAVPPG